MMILDYGLLYGPTLYILYYTKLSSIIYLQ